MSLNKRPPVHFTTKDKTYWRYSKLSKADWADVFCDIVEQYMGEGIQGTPCTPEQLMAEAERRLEILKEQGIR